jgi:hypothetical protein
MRIRSVTASALFVALAVLLLVSNIVAEDEPGALPLALLLTGIVWHAVARRRARSARAPREDAP